MKKIILAVAMVITGAYSMNVAAQTKTSLGVKLNGTLTDVRLTDLQGANTSFRAGGAFGGFVKIEFSENFALQPELMFNYTEAKVNYLGERNRYKYASVGIPVYAVGQFKVGNGKMYLGAGPSIGYGFSIDSDTEKLPEGHPDENKLELDHWNMGGGAMIGYEFRNGIQINAGYQMSFDLRSSSKVKGSEVKTHTISLGVGYRF